jgi:menaquinone-9 beta-reductase
MFSVVRLFGRCGLQNEVVVIGGGPAGAATALRLAQDGVGVLLLDRARFPRDKACGEFLTPQACRLMADLGVWEDVVAAGARPVAATTLIAPNGETLRHTSSDGKPAGWTIRRVALDAVLLQAVKRAGVPVREGFAVRTILRDESGTTWGVSGTDANGEPQTLPARIVIGADGSHSLVARQMNLVRALPRLQRVALVSHWRNVGGACDAIEMRSRGDLVCGVGYPGTEGENAANVTLVVPTAQASRIAGRQGDFLEQTIEAQFPDLTRQLSGAEREETVRTVGCFGHVCRPASSDGVLLVGDAATFIDPFTGEGVYFALRGAVAAAETAAFALRAGDVSRKTLSAYDRARAELRQRYLLCDLVQSVVRRPALIGHVIGRLKRSPVAADRLLSVLGDTRPPRAVLHPALLWRLLAPEIA